MEVPIEPAQTGFYRKVANGIRRAGLRCTCTGRGTATANLPSSDPASRRAGRDRLKTQLDIAAELGAEVLAGPWHCSPGQFKEDEKAALRSGAVLDGIAEASRYASTLNVKLSFEILNRFESRSVNTVAEGLDLVARLGETDVSIHYDTFHAHIEERSAKEAILAAGRHLGHVHFSESNRGIPGTGQVDWPGTADALHTIGYQGWIVTESFSNHEPGLVKGMHLWREVFSSPEEYARAALAVMRHSRPA